MSKSQSQIGKSNVRRSKSHERRVAKLLTNWTKIEFRRRRVEGRDESVIAKESTADVIAVDKTFKFSVEAKCGKGFSLNSLLASPEICLFTSWWFQASYDAKLLSDYLDLIIWPMLIFKPEPNFDWIAIPTSCLESIGVSQDTSIKQLKCLSYYYNRTVRGNISHGNSKDIKELYLDGVAMSRWKDFASTVDPNLCFHY
jgi:hypothetical protein